MDVDLIRSADMPFLTETEPERGALQAVLPGISRIVANNPGPMTYFGTNTYLIDTPEGRVVLDPGPEGHPEHVAAILRHTGGQVAFILVSHTHHDHIGAVPALKAATGAPTVGFRSGDETFDPDIKLDHEAVFAGMQALHTPGHALDHLCFARVGPDGDRVLFSADHVMSWSTSIVSPPGGDMRDYFASLKLLLGRDDDVYLPGHGPALREPRALVREMLTHRMIREQAIAEKLTDGGAFDTYTIMDTLYSQLNPRLRRAAERNVLAHLLKMEAEGKVLREGELWRAA
jgi:glyoxylase-like metal-dependent hydrolase (beta-lactamase superfamily II)